MSYQEALLLTRNRSDIEEMRQIDNPDLEVGLHHQKRAHPPVLDQRRSTETWTHLVLEPSSMEEDQQVDRVPSSASQPHLL